MRPLKIPEVNMQPSGNLKVKFTDCKVYGLERTQIKDFEIDPKAQKVKITLYINEVSMQADYDINGQILILPIQGKGPANIKFGKGGRLELIDGDCSKFFAVDGEYLFQFDWEVVERKGEKFAKIVNPKLTYETKRSYYRLDNLFNGDKLLGEETNRFLDENWQDINKDLGPAISETISQICVTIASNFFDRISYDQLFLP